MKKDEKIEVALRLLDELTCEREASTRAVKEVLDMVSELIIGYESGSYHGWDHTRKLWFALSIAGFRKQADALLDVADEPWRIEIEEAEKEEKHLQRVEQEMRETFAPDKK